MLDEKWKDHLYDLDQLRNAIHYRGWGQKDPLVEYKKEAYDMFEDLMHDIQSTFTERFLKIQVSAEPPRPQPPPASTRRRRPLAPTTCSLVAVHGEARRRRQQRPLGPRRGRRHHLPRSRRTDGYGGSAGRAQRPVPLWLGQEVQEVPRGRAVARTAGTTAVGWLVGTHRPRAVEH